MTKLSAILVDDEKAAHFAMLTLLKDYEHLIDVVAQAWGGKDAVLLINRLKPDIVFLDIQMPDLDGFGVLRALTYSPYIVFCTAYDQYAVNAFNENSIDYLLKPVEEKRFATCIDKIQRLLPVNQNYDFSKLMELSNQLTQEKRATAIPIHTKSKIILVRCEEIVYCLAADGYVSLFTTEGKEYICNLTLKQLEDRLPLYFIRVQKSYIVNKQQIDEIHKYFNNRLVLVMRDKNQTRITTGTSYIEEIRKELDL